MKIILKIVKWLLLIILAAIIIIAILNALPFTLGKVTKDNVFRTEDGLPLVIPHGGAKISHPRTPAMPSTCSSMKWKPMS